MYTCHTALARKSICCTASVCDCVYPKMERKGHLQRRLLLLSSQMTHLHTLTEQQFDLTRDLNQELETEDHKAKNRQ